MSKNNLQSFYVRVAGNKNEQNTLLDLAAKSGLFRNVDITPNDYTWLYVGSVYNPICDCYDFVYSDHPDCFYKEGATVEVSYITASNIITHAKKGITLTIVNPKLQVTKPEEKVIKPTEDSYLEASKKRLVEINKALALLQEERLSVENIIELNKERDILKEGW